MQTFFFSVSPPDLKKTLDELPAMLYWNGVMMWFPAGLFHTRCQVDMVYFPFDTQTCQINVTTLNEGKVVLQGTIDEIFSFVHHKGAMWSVVDLKVFNDVEIAYNSYRSSVTWTLTLKRQSGYFLMTTIMPLILLSVVGLMVFPLPPDSGEKVTLSVTCLMSFFLTQLSITEHMPTSWKAMPIISKCTYMM